MTGRAELIEQIAALEAERAQLEREEQVLDLAYWVCPDGPQAKMIDGQLDHTLQRIDDIGDELGPLRAELYLIEAKASRREFLADASYGRTL